LIIGFLLKDNPKFILEYLEWAENLYSDDKIKLTEKLFPILDYLGDKRNLKEYKYFEETTKKISNLKLSNKILILLLKHNRDGLLNFIKKFKPNFVTSSLKMIRDELNYINPYNNSKIIKIIKKMIRYGWKYEEDKKLIYDYILDLNLPIEILKKFPRLVIFYSKYNYGYFNELISKIKEKYEDVFDFFEPDIKSYINFLFTLKEKNKDLNDIISKIPMKTYFLDHYILDSILFNNPDLYEIIIPKLKTQIFEYTTSTFDWVGVLFVILEREPTYIQEFLTVLDIKTTFEGKRNEKKFIDEIEPMLDYLWDDFTGEYSDGIDQYSDIHISIINEIMEFSPSMDLFKNNPNLLILISKEYTNTNERYLKEYIIPHYKKTKSKLELSLLLKPVLHCLLYIEWRGDYGFSLLIDDQTRKKILKIIFRLRPSIDLFKFDARFLNFLNYSVASDYISQLDIKYPYFCDVSQEEAEILNSISKMVGEWLDHSPSDEHMVGYFQKDGHVSRIHLDEIGDDYDFYDYPELLNDLFRKLQGLTHLTHLTLNNNHIESLPENIGDVSSLITLELNNNKLEELPFSIGKLKSLKSLSVKNNKLKKLPENIGSLKSLEKLDLEDNSLNILPVSFWNLKNLRSLQLSGNQIKTLPDSIGNLSKLKSLWLSVNNLQKLPDSIGKLFFLKNFSIDCKKIDPDSISNLRNELNIHYFNN
jgi:hypothetical protein